MMNIKRKNMEGEEDKETIRYRWFTVIYYGPAIKQL